jgi:uncharacterized membrane protein
MRKHIAFIVCVLAFVGVVISGVSLAHKESFVSGAFCTFGGSFNCDIVNRGPFSEIYGIPVALIGVIGYGLLTLAAFFQIRQPSDRRLSMFLLLASVGGLVFSGYLTSLEAYVLRAWCVLCLISQTLILSIFFLTLWLWWHPKPIASAS